MWERCVQRDCIYEGGRSIAAHAPLPRCPTRAAAQPACGAL